ncbi:MAG: CocE/NonD family hydrolase [Paracoccaceae bacterium]
MSIETQLHDITEIPDLGIPLPDGTRLSARVWMPVDAAQNPVPAILEYLPYRKRDGTCARDALTHPYMAQRGYACVRVDLRGTGDSEGTLTDEYTPQELQDGVDVITWLAAQDWCSGSIGMMGISWGGFNSLQIAALQPEPLKAIITLCSTVDRFADDIHYKGGCLLNENLGWGATMWSYSSRAPDPALRPDWRALWLKRLNAEPFLPSRWLKHQSRDAYWAHGSVCEDYSQITAKVLAIGGWGDAYKNAVPQLVQNLPGAKGILGPWVHKYPHFATPEPRIGFLQEALHWWDRWLKDIPNGADLDPSERTYLMNGVRPHTWYTDRPGQWMADPKRTQTLYHLTDTGLTQTPGSLTKSVASPPQTGAQSGEYCAIWLGPEMPGDQRSDDALSLCIDSDPLPQDLDIAGAPQIRLTLTSDQAQAQLAVRLNHVHPDGATTRITYGVLNLSHRAGSQVPKPLVPGTPVTVTLDLDHIAYRVPAGHRIRVALSNAYWPLIWPSPASGTLTFTDGTLDVPIARPNPPSWNFPPPDAAPPWNTKTLRDENHIRRQETDLVSGAIHLIIEDDFGKRQDLEHGLITGSVARERWTIHPDDPLCASGQCHWTDALRRDDIDLRTETSCSMHADATTFYLTARLEAYENDVLIFEKDVQDEIPRENV